MVNSSVAPEKSPSGRDATECYYYIISGSVLHSVTQSGYNFFDRKKAGENPLPCYFICLDLALSRYISRSALVRASMSILSFSSALSFNSCVTPPTAMLTALSLIQYNLSVSRIRFRYDCPSGRAECKKSFINIRQGLRN